MPPVVLDIPPRNEHTDPDMPTVRADDAIRRASAVASITHAAVGIDELLDALGLWRDELDACIRRRAAELAKHAPVNHGVRYEQIRLAAADVLDACGAVTRIDHRIRNLRELRSIADG